MKAFLVFLAIVAFAVAMPHDLRERYDGRVRSNFTDFLTGFLEGINENGDINKLLECIEGGDDILLKIEEGIQLIGKGGFTNIVTGLERLMEGIRDLLLLLQPCSEGFEQIQKLIVKVFSADPAEIMNKFMRNIALYTYEITIATDCRNRGDYRCFGKYVGKIISQLFLEELTNTGNSFMEFLTGFLEGLNENGDVKELMKCVKDAEFIIEKIEEALHYIALGDPANLIKGITMLLETITELLNMLKPCSDGFEQLNKLFKMIVNADIEQLVFKILINPGPYVQDVVDAIECFKKGDFRQAGKDVGDFLYRLFLASEPKPGMNFSEFIVFIEGFLKGINQEHNFENFEECVKDVPMIMEEVEKVIAIFKDLNWKDIEKVVDAFIAFLEAFKRVLHAIRPCSKVPGEIDIILQKLINMDVNKLLQKITNNMMTLAYYMNDALSSFASGDFFRAGEDFGYIFFLLVLRE